MRSSGSPATPLSAFHSRRVLLVSAVLAAGAGAWISGTAAAEGSVKLAAPAFDPPAPGATQTAVFAGGCFWGVQAVFQHTRGVLAAVSGYAGGSREAASYERVGSGTTGHAESVQVTYDPKQVSYGKLLQVFFSVVHDPTQLDRQGPDSGAQYRSAIFYSDAAQADVARRYIAQLEAAHAWRGKIVTQVAPLTGFYRAEDHHQDYATLHPDSPYIAAFDLPKIAGLRRTMPEVYREQPVLVSGR